MGITGLLPVLREFLVLKPISSFRNKRIAIDGHAWIHQVLPFSAYELYYKLPTKTYITRFRDKLRKLLANKVIPVFVFDGDSLVSKAKTNENREKRREEYLKKVAYYLKRNDTRKANQYMKSCVKVTREVVYNIAKMLQNENIEYIISPYESDAQMCYLQLTKNLDYIMTEDTDLIAYGCTNILYKYDNMYVNEFRISCLEKAKDKFFKDNILEICILSGCDYLKSIKGIGFLTAYKYLKQYGTVKHFVKEISKKRDVPENYLEEFEKAKQTFLHQVVYDPTEQKRVHLTPIKNGRDFLGSLEETGYTVEEDSAGKRTKKLQRHFIPTSRKEPQSSKKGLTIGAGHSGNKEIDENIHSPYFENSEESE